MWSAPTCSEASVRTPTGIALWPVADLGIALYSGDGGLKSAGVNIGTWNSLNTGDTGAMGRPGSSW